MNENSYVSSFLKDFDNGNVFWRIYRRTTFIDYIVSLGNKYLINSTDSRKIELVNICIKSLIVNKLGELEPEANLNKTKLKIELQKETYLTEYEHFFRFLTNKDISGPSLILSDEINYLIILSKVKSNAFPADRIIDIAHYLIKD